MSSERENVKSGFQEDGSYVQKISRQTIGPDGKRGWNPPEKGQRIITRSGAFEVTSAERLDIDGKPYFKAEGKLVEKQQ